MGQTQNMGASVTSPKKNIQTIPNIGLYFLLFLYRISLDIPHARLPSHISLWTPMASSNVGPAKTLLGFGWKDLGLIPPPSGLAN